MAVVVKITDGNKYKVHRVFTPEGNTMVDLSMANAGPGDGDGFTQGATLRGEVDSPTDSASKNTVPNRGADVKRYSVSNEDSQGRMLTPEQKRFFRNSKVRDIQGRLLAVYHGTKSMGFTIFDPAKSHDLISLFFSAGRNTARTYSDTYGKVEDTYAIDRDTDMGQFSRPASEQQIREALREAGYELTSGEMITDRAEAEAFAAGKRTGLPGTGLIDDRLNA